MASRFLPIVDYGLRLSFFLGRLGFAVFLLVQGAELVRDENPGAGYTAIGVSVALATSRLELLPRKRSSANEHGDYQHLQLEYSTLEQQYQELKKNHQILTENHQATVYQLKSLENQVRYESSAHAAELKILKLETALQNQNLLPPSNPSNEPTDRGKNG
ncbi:hypothetical protein PN498_28405 [Oscillatoria sp. CS-180]|uniref:hypothetical protein n=1 Tax=Oscillatoria sp. CS-180 TaxID=3021720 RepID=UPI00232F688C|nr:hypothetical protein [Oscillatoria sp. CS-180]MDB9529942.1 hypothetical protein [Oscillatoria sp. CS-180]